ncbi:hypothetical protein N7456_001114 [Penicillium angulare]|uniref:Uncharacterized protein n=1 Tax=Penicillium angulare TaxID=116970 RepID=A0A9W9GDT2_9EURO|nr:hypothetical protein N7456_001114 [Penicillium angulare]
MSATTSMSTTTTSASATATACTGSVWELPGITDAACGAANTGNMTSVFDTCCKGDKPTTYNKDCGIYCLAQNQNVSSLLHCLQTESNNYQAVFCNDKLNATATAAATTTKSTGTSTGTKTSGTSTSTHSKNAAVGAQPVSTMGVGVLAVLFCSAMMGIVA